MRDVSARGYTASKSVETPARCLLRVHCFWCFRVISPPYVPVCLSCLVSLFTWVTLCPIHNDLSWFNTDGHTTLRSQVIRSQKREEISNKWAGYDGLHRQCLTYGHTLDHRLALRLPIYLLAFAPFQFHACYTMERKWAHKNEESLRDKRGGPRT